MVSLGFNFSEEQYLEIEDLSACNYLPEKIALYFGLDKQEFMDAWNDENGTIRHHYNRGKMVAEFQINSNQKRMAAAGNITATQIYFKETEKIEFKNILNKVLYGDEY